MDGTGVIKNIQSITFKKKFWNVTRARKWLKDHDYLSTGKVDRTITLLRFRQQSPSKFKRFRTKKITKTISFVLGFN